MLRGRELRAEIAALEQDVERLEARLQELREFGSFLETGRDYESSGFSPAKLRALSRKYGISAEDFDDEGAIEKIALEIKLWSRRLSRAKERLAELGRAPEAVPFFARLRSWLQAAALAILAVIALAGQFAAQMIGALVSRGRFVLILLAVIAIPAFILWAIWLGLRGDDTIAQRPCEEFLSAREADGGPESNRDECVTVYFATPRAVIKDKDAAPSRPASGGEPGYQPVSRFTKHADAKGALYWGRAEVAVLKRNFKYEKKQGEKFDFAARLRTGVALNQIRVTTLSVGAGGAFDSTKDHYFKQLSDDVQSKADGKVLFFVHGFNVKFDDALTVAARLSIDLNIKNEDAYVSKGGLAYGLGQPFLFSWPNKESMSEYDPDRDHNAPAAGRHLAEAISGVIRATSSDSGAGTATPEINLVVHSMGNRVLLSALQSLAEDPALRDNSYKIRIVHVAAEPGRKEYAEAVKSFEERLAQLGVEEISLPKVSVYSDADDFALALAEFRNGSPRVGKHGNKTDPFVYRGAGSSRYTTIDSTGFESDWNHSYFSDSPSVVADIACALKDVEPEQRMLIGQPTSQTQWWRMSDDDSTRSDLLPACKLTPLPPIDPCEPYGRVRGWPIIGKWLAALLFPEGAKKCEVAPENSCEQDPTRSWCVTPPAVVTPEPVSTGVPFKIGKSSLREVKPGEISETERLKGWLSKEKGDETIERILILVRAKDEDLARRRFATLSEIVKLELGDVMIERSQAPLVDGNDAEITVYFKSRVESKDPSEIKE